jgi:5-azacytidine-induced protein 1
MLLFVHSILLVQDMTIKGLEPDIQRLINKHKAEIKRIKEQHEAELLNTDGKAAQRYMAMMEELRVQLEHDKEAAVAREREMAKERCDI